MRLLTLNAEESSFLAREVKKKYEAISGEELVITSYLARYEGLSEIIKLKTHCIDVEIVSNGLLRKLLESGKNQESTKINRQFIDVCYLFITDCQHTRTQYNEKYSSSTEHRPKSSPSTSKLNWPFKGQQVRFSVRKDVFVLSMIIVGTLLTWTLASNWQYVLMQVPSPAPQYLWWVAEYPDGTKVYNSFRRYRTEKEVIDYFLGRYLEEGVDHGDCNAVYWSNNNRFNVCYDIIEKIRDFEEQHGGKPEIRFDG